LQSIGGKLWTLALTTSDYEKEVNMASLKNANIHRLNGSNMMETMLWSLLQKAALGSCGRTCFALE